VTDKFKWLYFDEKFIFIYKVTKSSFTILVWLAGVDPTVFRRTQDLVEKVRSEPKKINKWTFIYYI
jgi:hypothetical protein